MSDKRISKGNSHRKSGKGILIGIPLLLFISGVTLISIGTYNYLRYAFFLSRIFIQSDYKPKANKQVTIEKKKVTFPSFGDEYGELTIKSSNIDVPIYFGDTEDQLLKGIGHYAGSRFPGENGNIVLLGHRNSVFRNLKNIKKGDLVNYKTTYGNYLYKVNDIKIVSGKDESILKPSDKEKLTIYTCYPFNYIGNAPDRFVVSCELVEGTPLKELMLKEGN